MEPKILSRPAFTVVGMMYRGKNDHNEIPQMWQRFGPRAREIKHLANPGVSYGVVDNYDEATGEFDYVAGVEVDSVSDLPEDMVSWNVPEQTYAVFPCTLPTLMETYNHAYKAWLPRSGYQRDMGPEFELYDEDFEPNQDMYIYIPVLKG